MAIEGVRSTLPDPAYIAALERKIEKLEADLTIVTQQTQTVSSR